MSRTRKSAHDNELLDNVVWSALTSTHANVAIGAGSARQYPRDMAPFAAIADPGEAAYRDLGEMLAPGQEARLFRPSEEPAPPGWETISARPILQMIADRAPDDAVGTGLQPLSLGSADVPAMLALAEAAKPGPFGPRTIELGQYVGLRDENGALIAMAGERFRLPGHVEISAVAVHPGARGRGIGAALTAHLMRCALERGEIPFLHVFPDNPAAQLYARLGFRERARLWVIWRRPQK